MNTDLPSTRPILVLGAGELGIAILRALSSHPSQPPTTILLRPQSGDTPSRQTLLKELEALNVQVIYGNLKSPASELANILAPFDTVINCSGFTAGKGTQIRICEAALQAGVRRYVPWQFGVDYDAVGRGSAQDLFDEQLDVRDLLRAQDKVRWTIISTGIFTSYLFEPSFGVVDLSSPGSEVVRAFGSWSNRVTMTSVEDIGRLTSLIVLNGEGLDGVVYVAGDTVTFAQVLEVVRSLGWDVETELVTVDQLERERKEKPDDVVLKYRMVWAVNRGVAWDFEATWNHQQGVQAESLREWAERFVPRPMSG